jgi:hypothetical protein
MSEKINFLCRLINVLLWSILVYFTPTFKDPSDNSFSYFFYFIYFAMSFFGGGTSFIMYMALSSFFSQISDKEVGATYLTFIGMWSSIGKIFFCYKQENKQYKVL